VPYNWAGNANAHSGKAYTGIISGGCAKDDRMPSSYREYLQGSLSGPMIANQEYTVEFYFKLSSNSGVTIDRIGLMFTGAPLNFENDNVIPMKPHIDFQRSEMDAGPWEHVSISYKAKGDEQNFIIGNFYSDAQTQCARLDYRHGRSDMIAGAAYFYIDDVKIERIINPDQGELIWANGESITTDRSYVMNNIQFAFDSHELTASSFSVLDSVGMILQTKPEWKIEISGHCDDRGDEEYNLQLSVQRARAVSAYLQKLNVAPTRMVAKGFGSAIPLKHGNDEFSWDVNRRVEIRFYID
jgi:outer membrane protein OmpA-like peptidoglycan-associated protein